MLMKRWRVGSLSMGLVLVAFGVLILVSLITRINVINVVYMLSPIVLICLGIEILLHLFIRNGSDDVKIKYDFLSIMFISVILLIGTGIYILTGLIGFFDSKEDAFAAFGIRSETVYSHYNGIEFDADEIALFGTFNNGNIQILSSDSDKIKVEYSIMFNTSDKNYGESVADKIIKFDTEQQRVRMISDTALIYYDRKFDYPAISCSIYLPEDKLVDLSGCSYNREISVDRRINAENIIK